MCHGWEGYHPIAIEGDTIEAPDTVITPPIGIVAKPPGPVARTFVTPDKPVKVPPNFIGNHVCVDIERYLQPAWGGSAMPAPQYPYKWVRTLTAAAMGGYDEVEICSWPHIERNGVTRWAAVVRARGAKVD